MDHWGKHLMIDARNGSSIAIKNKNHITEFVTELLEKIDMVILAPLWIEYCETNDPMKVGISYVQVLQDSHSSGHFCDVTGDFYIDVFSCKDFDETVVTEMIEDYFLPQSYNVSVLLRDAKEPSYHAYTKNVAV